MQNEINFEMSGHMVTATFTNVQHRRLAAFPPKFYVLTRTGATWSPGDPIAAFLGRREEWLRQYGSPWTVINHNGTGQDFQLLAIQQRGSAPAWYSTNGDYHILVPEAGLTMQQAWDKYGMAFRGDVYDDHEVIAVEGIVNGVARPGRSRQLGPPRLVLTSPNVLAPASVTARGIRMHLAMTGVFGSELDVYGLVAIDGAQPVRTRMRYHRGTQQLWSSATAPGTHTVSTWRVDATGKAILSSEMTFCYFVEAPTAPCPAMRRR
jgi:hypothetical protein